MSFFSSIFKDQNILWPAWLLSSCSCHFHSSPNIRLSIIDLDFRLLSNQFALVKVTCVNKGKGNRDGKPQKKPPPTEQIIKCRTVDENTDFWAAQFIAFLETVYAWSHKLYTHHENKFSNLEIYTPTQSSRAVEQQLPLPWFQNLILKFEMCIFITQKSFRNKITDLKPFELKHLAFRGPV